MGEPEFLGAVRESYDTVAAAYVEQVPDVPGMEPLSRATLTAFAEMVGDRGPVADLGCGPGRLTKYLSTLGVDAFGIDLSPRMIAQARSAFPELRFEVGSMTALELPDGELAGVLAYWSTHHSPPDHRAVIFAEFHRVLAPGGHLLLGTFVGDSEVVQARQGYGLPVSYQSHLLPTERLAEMLAETGFSITATLTEPGRKRDSATFFAVKD